MGWGDLTHIARLELRHAPSGGTMMAEGRTMGLCVKCNRVLAANGSCLYCGTMMGAEAVENRRRASGGRLRRILLRILYVSIGLLIAHFLFFTEPGKALVQKVRGAVGL